MSFTIDRSGWQKARFGDLVANINSYYDAAEHGELPFVAGPHVTPGILTIPRYGLTSDDDFPPTFKRLFQAGDVLLHSRGIEKIAVVDRAGVTGEKLFVLRTRDPDRLDQRFLPWLLTSPQSASHMRDHFTGSVNKFLNWKPLAEYEIDLPPFSEQRRLASLLWAAEESGRAERALARHVAKTAVVRAEEVFVAGGDETPLKTCRELCKEIRVGVVIRPTQYYVTDGVPALRSLNVLPNRFSLDELVHFDRTAHAELKKSTLAAGDVVIVRTGRPGDAAVVNDQTAGFNCIDLIIARPGPTLDPHYLSRLLNSPAGRAHVLKNSAGTAQQHFNVGALAQVEIPVPPLARQREIAEELAALDRTHDSVDNSAMHAYNLRDALMRAVWERSA